ncbi:MAG: LptA/OstA family protein [Candidatus Margulisiibacteriota bacterium]
MIDLLKKAAFFILVVFILFLFVWALYLPKQDVTKTLTKTIEEQKSRMDMLFEGVTFQETQNGIKYWEIKAKTSSLNKSTGRAELKEARGTFFKAGKPALKFISPYVIWNMNKKEITLKEPIGFDEKAESKVQELIKKARDISTFILPARALKKEEGYFFKARELNWVLKDKQIVCSGGIYLKKGEISGLADKLEADVGLERVKIFGKPCVINLINQSINTLEAQSFIVDSVNDKLTASGGIVLTTEGLKLTAMEMNYLQDKDTILFKPSVKITYLDAQAKSDIASYDVKNRVISLEKNAELTRNGSNLTGDKVLVSLKNKTFKVFGKSKIVIPGEDIK